MPHTSNSRPIASKTRVATISMPETDRMFSTRMANSSSAQAGSRILRTQRATQPLGNGYQQSISRSVAQSVR